MSIQEQMVLGTAGLVRLSACGGGGSALGAPVLDVRLAAFVALQISLINLLRTLEHTKPREAGDAARGRAGELFFAPALAPDDQPEA